MTFDKILIVDDELAIRKLLEHHLRRRQYEVSVASTLAEARCLMEQTRFDLVLLDLCLPDGDGLELLEKAGQGLVVVMSGHSNVEAVIRCLRGGAFDYVAKPFSLEELQDVIDRAESSRHAARVNPALMADPDFGINRCTEWLPWRNDDGFLPGNAPATAQLRALVEKVAPTEAAVLISGENGVGKERVAWSVHRASLRAAGPLVKIHCAASTEGEIEKELFGSGQGEEGGGALEMARGGTLVLEEISELPLRVQVKLFRILQGRRFERPGCDDPVSVDVRLIGTTGRDLAECVAQGTFRQDFFFRLNVFPVPVPPLRNRIADLPRLAAHWAEGYARLHGLKPAVFSESALRHLMAYSWPGNVRELENVLERAVILAGDGQRIEVDAFDFLETSPSQRQPGSLAYHPAGTADGLQAIPLEDEGIVTLGELEKRHVFRALEYTNQNRTRAASLLKISVRTLRNKLHQYRAEMSGTPVCRQSHLPMVAQAGGLKRNGGVAAAAGESVFKFPGAP